MRYRALLILAVAAFLIGVAVRADGAPGDPHALVARVAVEGRVRVIVELSAPFVPEGHLSALAAERQRQGIAAAQAHLVAGLAGTEHRIRWLFTSIPFAALEVGAPGLQALDASPWVVSIQEDEIHPLALDTSVPLVEADQMISAGSDGSGQTVVVIDTGVDSAHPNLSGKLVDEACFASNGPGPNNGDCPNGKDSDFGPGSGAFCDYSDECFHGTHVAGIAVGNGPSFSGVAQGASLISIQVTSRFDSDAVCGSGNSPCPRPLESDMIKAVEEVLSFLDEHSIASVNMSIGGTVFSSQSSCDANNGAMKAAIDNLRSVGVPTVVASGNNADSSGISEPGCISSAVSVGATTDSDESASFSNAASFLSLWAPGVGIRAPRFDSTGYRTASGTSMATPHVAGAWAILAQAVPGVSVTQALAALQATGQPISHSTANTTRIKIRAAYEDLTFDCEDGLDNDDDGRVDWAGGDPGCASQSDDTETSDLLVCDNGVDDDGDGLIDTSDPACSSGDPYVPDPNALAELTQCQDGLDNDGQAGIDFDGGFSLDQDDDGLIDAVFNPDTPPVGAADTQCVNRPWKNTEGSSGRRCGLGFEFALLLPALMWLRQRRRRLA